MHGFANPKKFMDLSKWLMPLAGVLAIICFAIGLYLSLFVAPADYQMGETVRIMFVHVPAAWMALFVYTIMALSSAAVIIWRHPVAEIAAKTAAPIGAAFTAISLVTGSLWGKPMWGTWWVWDARLTSVLLLFFLYIGYMAVWRSMEDESKAGRIASILALVGFINIPIIKFSVDWWNSLHQPASVFRADGPSIHGDMLWALLVMAMAYGFSFTALHLASMRSEIMKRRIRNIEIAQLENG